MGRVLTVGPRILIVGPNKAVVVTKKRQKKITSASWAYAAPLMCNIQFLSLNLMTLKPQCKNAETSEGVPVCVSGAAHCKIMNDHEHLLIAAEQFLGFRRKKIAKAITLTLEGHLRAILGTMTVEDIFKDIMKFADLVHDVAGNDVANMGIQIVSFVITGLYDEVGYLDALGKARTAEVKRDARIGVALADRDAGIKEAECEKEASEVVYRTRTNIENYYRMYNVQKSEYDKEVYTAKAEAKLAYSLRLAQIEQELRYEELAISIIEKKKLTEIESKEIERNERALVATVKLPSEAESYRIQTIASGNKTDTVERAIGESEGMRKAGQSVANRIRKLGLAEADRMLKRALIFKNYGDAAISHLVLKSLPDIAAQISAPLAKTEEIVIIGTSIRNSDDSVINELTTLAAGKVNKNSSVPVMRLEMENTHENRKSTNKINKKTKIHKKSM